MSAVNHESFSTREVYVSKKPEIVPIARDLLNHIERNLGITWITNLTLHNNYIVDGINKNEFIQAERTIFSEAPVDEIMIESEFKESVNGKKTIVIESLPGQFDDRVEAVKSNLILQTGRSHNVRVKQIISFEWDISDKDLESIKKDLINPNEKQESSLKDKKLERVFQTPKNHVKLNGFINISTDNWFQNFIEKHSLSINIDDLRIIHKHFKEVAKRNPTLVEMMLIDTYWSDHCRHSTFLTQITDVEFSNDSIINQKIKETHEIFQEKSREYWKSGNTLMEAATASARFLKNDPKFEWTEFLDESDEDNAASYKTIVELDDGTKEEWIIMFKNETHNSPTETEPFWWAATCLGWAIRDTLSGRAFTFAAMRVSGSRNPTEAISEASAHKLSQRAISLWAMLGYSSYGNQIGLATGRVREYFHPWYAAKRFECGYVAAAVKSENLKRKKPKAWDKVIVFGWATGRDWKWGAAISSNSWGTVDQEALWAHVQKWNPVEERKMQRLLLNPKFTQYIKLSNDFGAWWVSVALWEIASWIDINLDEVAKHVKYNWLSDDDLVLSESQERMAIVIAPEHYGKVMEMIAVENINAFQAATVTSDEKTPENDRLKIIYKGKETVNIKRSLLNTNGAERFTKAKIESSDIDFFEASEEIKKQISTWSYIWALKMHLSELSHASQKWLHGNFDNSVWASTILAPYGWKYQNSPQIVMASKIPTFDWVDAKTAIISTFWYNPDLLSQNTYLWWMYAIIETISKVVAAGWDEKKTWMSLQEYFGKLSTDEKWWEVYAGLLGTLKVLLELKVAAIGWKDSMSGTYKDPDTGEIINVPPTIVWFANAPTDSENIISAEFQKPGNTILHFPIKRWDWNIPDLEDYKNKLSIVKKLISKWKVFSSSVVEQSWLYGTLVNMTLWNKIWIDIDEIDASWFVPNLWDIILEVSEETAEEYKKRRIWKTISKPNILIDTRSVTWSQNTGLSIENAEAILNWTLEWVFPSKLDNTANFEQQKNQITSFTERNKLDTSNILTSKPKVIIPVFPGTNSELDTRHSLLKAWYEVEEFVFLTQSPEWFKKSRQIFASLLKTSHMIIFPWWFSNGDEPDGSAKFIANIMRSPEIRDAFQEFLDRKWTVTVGICNGFQALIKLWLFEEGKINDYQKSDDPTLTYNTTMRHQTELVKLQVKSVLPVAMYEMEIGEEYLIPISNGEGRLILPQKTFEKFNERGQIALQYKDEDGNPTNKYNGSDYWVAGISDPSGRIFGLMPHPERTWLNVFKNVPGEKYMPVFEGIYNAMNNDSNE